MNIFVLNTGRCGSSGFNAACGHITNYTVGQEERACRIGPDRIAYPDNHIEVDHRLSWFLGRLDEKYGDSAYYVHLTRDREACARTQGRHWSWQGSMIMAWHNSILKMSPVPRIEAARDMVDAVTENIRLFLKDKTHWMPFRVENAEADFRTFWDWIGAEGNLEQALEEFRVSHNKTSSKVSRVPIVMGHLVQRAVRFYR